MNADLRAWAEVNLDAIGNNISQIKSRLSKGTMLMGVVKANGYGHGACAVAEELIRGGADQLAVAFADEAEELRRNGFDVPILILGKSSERDIERIVELDIMPAVSDIEFAQKLSDEAVAMGKSVRVHIKIDTGMSRIGFMAEEQDTIENIIKISQLPCVIIEGLFTHFASADEEDCRYTELQFKRFMAVSAALEKAGVIIPVKHVCNSAGLVRFPHMHLDMVRAGIILYGIYPSADFDKSLIDLMPAMTFCSRITHIKQVEEGVPLSYGRTYIAAKNSKIATVSVGYADGYPRLLSGKASVQVGENILPQVGRICMDQCMIDASAVNNINVGDRVVLFGGTTEGVSTENVANLLGTIGYELVCGVGRRVPRIYIRNGVRVGLKNYLFDT